MNRGGNTALLIAGLALAGCASTTPVKVRAVGDPASRLPSGDRLAVARGQLMLGNVGLALEELRKAQREQPNDPAILAAIGDCYSSMSRFDLAQSNYEAALALVPNNASYLLGLAAIYEREGLHTRAMAARADAAAKTNLATLSKPIVTVANSVPAIPAVAPVIQKPHAVGPGPGPVSALAATPRPTLTPAAAMVTATAPKPAVAPAAAPIALVTPARAPATPAAPVPISREPTRPAAPVRAPAPVVVAEPVSAAAAAAAAPVSDTFAGAAHLGSITVALPPARPADHLEAHTRPIDLPRAGDLNPVSQSEVQIASTVTVKLPPARPVRAAQPVIAAQSIKLVRLSLGEVALVTNDKPLWMPLPVQRTAPVIQQMASVSPRWLPLQLAGARNNNMTVLNAARSPRLAASTRQILFDRGWRKIAIADAPAAQGKSVVLYPKGRETLGRRLAAQFGLTARMIEGEFLVLVLGRDSVSTIKSQRRS